MTTNMRDAGVPLIQRNSGASTLDAFGRHTEPFPLIGIREPFPVLPQIHQRTLRGGDITVRYQEFLAACGLLTFDLQPKPAWNVLLDALPNSQPCPSGDQSVPPFNEPRARARLA